MPELSKFDAADYLDNDEVIAEFLIACLEDNNPDVFLAGLESVAKAKGMTWVAEASGLNRESLYKALAPGAHPRHETIRKVVQALGFEMTITPKMVVGSGRRRKGGKSSDSVDRTVAAE